MLFSNHPSSVASALASISGVILLLIFLMTKSIAAPSSTNPSTLNTDRGINETGITPDVISELDADLYEKEGTDSQLRDAVEYLNREDAGQELNAAMAS